MEGESLPPNPRERPLTHKNYGFMALGFGGGSGLHLPFFCLSYSYDFEAQMRGFPPFLCLKSSVPFSPKPRDKEGEMEGEALNQTGRRENGEIDS